MDACYVINRHPHCLAAVRRLLNDCRPSMIAIMECDVK
jgi:hypothetical protein